MQVTILNEAATERHGLAMRRKSFADMRCALAGALEEVGEWWSLMIVRDAGLGLARFDEFQRSLGIAPNTLASRLKGLVRAGVLTRVRYQEHPPRDAYRLTKKGRDLLPAVMALIQWGDRWETHGAEGAPVAFVNHETGEPVRIAVVDARTGTPVDTEDVEVRPGPGADEITRWRLATGKANKGPTD